jgi:small-conductance mechanosensitive channel
MSGRDVALTNLTNSSWFGWALALIIGVPVLMYVLTELHAALVRRRSALARPVALVRNYVLPAGALLILLTKASEVSDDNRWVKVVATIFGFLTLILVLAVLNALLFGDADEGTWRRRMPSIFIDIARLVLIVIGLGMIFSWVWDTNVTGLFAALGVTGIVVGLALQNAVGSIISGLLLLFEQPFQLGDWLEAGAVRGRVVQVNWRAAHIDTGNGIKIMPNAALAGSSFNNLSDTLGLHEAEVKTEFSLDDPPDVVCELLDRVAAGLADLPPDAVPVSAHVGPKTYQTAIPVRSPAAVGATVSAFRRRLWYASRRAGLHLDGAGDEFATAEHTRDALAQIAPSLQISEEDVGALAPSTTLERYGAGEVLQLEGEVPEAMRYVIWGQVLLTAGVGNGASVPVQVLESGEYVGSSTLTRQPVRAGSTALTEVTVLVVPRAVIERLVAAKPTLAREIGEAIDLRNDRIGQALQDAGVKPGTQLNVVPSGRSA